MFRFFALSLFNLNVFPSSVLPTLQLDKNCENETPNDKSVHNFSSIIRNHAQHAFLSHNSHAFLSHNSHLFPAKPSFVDVNLIPAVAPAVAPTLSLFAPVETYKFLTLTGQSVRNNSNERELSILRTTAVAGRRTYMKENFEQRLYHVPSIHNMPRSSVNAQMSLNEHIKEIFSNHRVKLDEDSSIVLEKNKGIWYHDYQSGRDRWGFMFHGGKTNYNGKMYE